jgi:hypothetical protein
MNESRSSPAVEAVAQDGSAVARKRSKWENQAAEEDEQAIKIKKKAKLAAQERRRRERSVEEREREERLGKLDASSPLISMSDDFGFYGREFRSGGR